MRRTFFLFIAFALLASSGMTRLARSAEFAVAATPAPVKTMAIRPVQPTSAPTVAASAPPCVQPPNRIRVCDPGRDLEADSFAGNLTNNAFVFKGNVVLHSDPKVDKSTAETQSDDPITLTADEVDVERVTLRYVAKGKVHYIQGVRDGNADTAILDEKTHNIDLIGHARVFDGANETKADRMHYNTQDKKFHGQNNVRILIPIPTASPAPPGTTPTPSAKKRRIPKLPV